MSTVTFQHTSGDTDAVEVLKSMAHPGRFRILGYLAKNSATVGEIEDHLNMSQSAVSKSLSRLREAEMVQTERAGRFIEYSIANPKTHQLISSLHTLLSNPAS